MMEDNELLPNTELKLLELPKSLLARDEYPTTELSLQPAALPPERTLLPIKVFRCDEPPP
jgi:hypothetical protein